MWLVPSLLKGFGPSSGGVVVIGPLVTVEDPLNSIGDTYELQQFEHEVKSHKLEVKDANGVAVDLSSVTLRVVVETAADSPVAQFSVEDGTITVAGASNNEVTFPVSALQSSGLTPTVKYNWKLWNATSDQVLMHGPFTIVPSSDNAAVS